MEFSTGLPTKPTMDFDYVNLGGLLCCLVVSVCRQAVDVEKPENCGQWFGWEISLMVTECCIILVVEMEVT
jgi:hypothetical protein